jgi:hypothetical protein
MGEPAPAVTPNGAVPKAGVLGIAGLLLSLGGNAYQFVQTNADIEHARADTEKVRGELQQLKDELAHRAEKSAQDWNACLQQCGAVLECRATVLAAVLATSPDEGVREWASREADKVQRAIDSRKVELTHHAGVPAHPESRDAGAAGPADAGHPPPQPPTVSSADVAREDLHRIESAEKFLKTARGQPR